MQRVLVIDPMKLVRHRIRIILGSQGYEVYEASNDLDALLAMTFKGVELIVMGPNFPSSKKDQLESEMREDWIDTPIVILEMEQGQQRADSELRVELGAAPGEVELIEAVKRLLAFSIAA